MLKYLISITILLAASNTFGQTPKRTAVIRKITKRMAYVGELHCERISRVGFTSNQYLRFDSLRRYCTTSELTQLMEHKSPVVRSYAFWALSEKADASLYTLVYKHRQDTTMFFQRCGCFGSESNVIDSMMQVYRKTEQYKNDSKSTQKRVNLEQIAKESSNRFSVSLQRRKDREWALERYKRAKRSEKRFDL